MKKIIIKYRIFVLLIPIFWLFSVRVDSQYSKLPVSLIPTYNSAVNWVDIDSDGDLDLALSGADVSASSGQGRLYLNAGGFNPASTINIHPMASGDQKWSDFNNDGLPDLLYAGTTSVRIAGIDTLDGSLGYHNYFSGFIPVSDASVDWGDFDNDGDYDVLISGKNESGLIITNLYRNDKGSFTNINTVLPGIIYGEAVFVDYDLDMDLDIFISGRDVNTNKYARLWKNNNGIFQITGDIFTNLENSRSEWADFNGDGYPDLLLCGKLATNIYKGLLYINNAGVDFSLSTISVPGAGNGGLSFGDTDNDGDPDVFISGNKTVDSLKTKFIFLNKPGGLFSSDFTSNYVYAGFHQFGDYNNDNKLDFAANGANISTTNGNSYIATNTCSAENEHPSTPINPVAVVDGRNVILKWDPSSDNNTPVKSLTYNIYVGTGAHGIDVVSPIANIADGYRRIARQGYIQDTCWLLKNLAVGTYYWGVQAIDNSLGTSAFSTEGTFEIKERFSKKTFTETSPSTSPVTFFDCDHDNDLDMLLHYNTASFWAAENIDGEFNESNYRTILSPGYFHIQSLTPNDYDNNNKIDFTVSGHFSSGNRLDTTLALFRYNAAFDYDIADSSIFGNINSEYVLWADLDNDGRQDLISSGKTTNLGSENKPVTRVYKNEGNGNFKKTGNYIRGFEKTGAVTGDFDNDLDADIIIYGKDSLGIANTYLYRNNGNFNFSEILLSGNDLFRSQLIYGIYTGDFNLDGRLDLFLSGLNSSDDKYARVLINNGSNFYDANMPLIVSGSMSNFWADYDYDGDLDIFITSSYTSPDKVRLYLNNNGSLEETIINLGAARQADLPFMAVNLDNQYGLDFVTKINAGPYYEFYDNWGTGKKIDNAPSGLGYDQDKLDMILKWVKLPGCPACTYNIRIGTTTGGTEIMSPMSDLATGYRYVAEPGNTYLNNNWKISKLPVGTYYWSVQAVDPSNTGGPWAPESTFIVSHIDADFSFTTVCLGDSTSFTDLSVSTGLINKWKWIFGDGATSNLRNPKHSYSTSGSFTAGLWAYSEAGDSAYQSYTVLVKNIAIVDFSSDIACHGNETSINNNTNQNGITISSWLWDFGDGQTSTVRDPATHGYLNPGEYLVKLTASADNGCISSKSKSVIVAAVPVAAVTAGGLLSFCKGDSVKLTVSRVADYLYTWKLSGTSITGATKNTYTAINTGNYTVEVINPLGNCKTISSPVSITTLEIPVAPLIIADGQLSICQNDSVKLSVPATSGYSYYWKLKGGVVGSNTNIHYAKLSGDYLLSVENASGCSVNSTNKIIVTVNQNPLEPEISKSGPTTFCKGGNVVLSTTQVSGNNYQWRSQYGIIQGASLSSYIATISGSYSLDVSNSWGCSVKSLPVIVQVNEAPEVPVIIADGQPTFCAGDSLNLSVTGLNGNKYSWKHNGGTTGFDSNLFAAKDGGTYTVEVSNNFGCKVTSANSITTVIIPSPPAFSVSLSGPTDFCQGGSLLMSVVPTTGYSYQWSNEHGTITGASSNSFSASTSGQYSLTLTNQSGCKTSSPFVKVVVKDMPPVPIIVTENYQSDQCSSDGAITLKTDQPVQGYLYKWKRNGIIMEQYSSSSITGFISEGDYVVEVDNNGCRQESSPKNIVYARAPEKPKLYVQGPVVWYMAASNDTASKYRWYRNDELIQGAEKFIYLANKKLGTYKVAVGNNAGCYTMSDPVTIPVSKAEMTSFKIPAELKTTENIDPFVNIKIYPNPTSGLFTIEMDNSLVGELNIDIFSQAGRKILNIKFEKTTDHFKSDIDLGGQAKGMYIINLLLNSFSATRKVMVE